MLWTTNAADEIDVADVAGTLNTNAAWTTGLAQPERNLLLAVLVDAIQRYRRRATIQDGARRRELNESARWILCDDRYWPYSFINVCEALGIEPRSLRRALIEGRFSATTVEREHASQTDLRRTVIARVSRQSLESGLVGATTPNTRHKEVSVR